MLTKKKGINYENNYEGFIGATSLGVVDNALRERGRKQDMENEVPGPYSNPCFPAMG
jgi:hypothetical protein